MKQNTLTFRPMACGLIMLVVVLSVSCGGAVGESDPLPEVNTAPPDTGANIYTDLYTVSSSTFAQYFDSKYAGQKTVGAAVNPTTFSAMNTSDKGLQVFVGDGGSVENISEKNHLKLVGLSASNTTEVRVVVKFPAYSFNNCTNIYKIDGVTTTPGDYIINLNSPIDDNSRSKIGATCGGVIPTDSLANVDSLIVQAFQDGMAQLTLSKIQVSK
jgi:hypothetical protein